EVLLNWVRQLREVSAATADADDQVREAIGCNTRLTQSALCHDIELQVLAASGEVIAHCARYGTSALRRSECLRSQKQLQGHRLPAALIDLCSAAEHCM